VVENISVAVPENSVYVVLPYGTYRWRVVAVNALGENVSAVWRFTVVALWRPVEGWSAAARTPAPEWTGASAWAGRVLVPGFAISVTPSSATVTAGDSTSAVVEVSPAPVYPYVVELSVSGVPAGVSVRLSPASGTPPFSSSLEISVSTDAQAGTYELRITGTGADGTVRSVTFMLTIEAPAAPPPPAPAALPPSSAVVPISPFWQAEIPITITAEASDEDGSVVAVALYYRFSADGSEWSGWMLYEIDNTPPWSWSFSAPQGEGFYEFYSVATDDDGNTESAPAEADARCGVDTSAPPTPKLVAPLDWEMVTTTRPLFEWDPVEDLSGVRYELEIYADPALTSLVLSKSGLAEPGYRLGEDEELSAGTYWWRVRAVNGAGLAGEWSQARFIVVELAPSALVSAGPVAAWQPAVLDLSQFRIFIVRVWLVVRENIDNLQVGVREFTEEEFRARFAWIGLPEGAVYRYYGLLSPSVGREAIAETVVEFKVAREWVENGWLENIRLVRWENGRWIVVRTWLENAGDGYIYYRARMDGFSALLAVVGSERAPVIVVPVPAVPLFAVVLLAVFVAFGGALGYAVYIRKLKPVPPKVPLQRLARAEPRALPAIKPRVPPAAAPAVTLAQLKPVPVKRIPAPPVPAKPIRVVPIPPAPPVPPAEVLRVIERVPARVPGVPPEISRRPEVLLQQLRRVAKPVEPAVPMRELERIRRAPAIPVTKIREVARPMEPAVVLEELKRAARGAEGTAIEVGELGRIARPAAGVSELERLKKIVKRTNEQG
jgi:PGF-pre-PGF domain-containing protein